MFENVQFFSHLHFKIAKSAIMTQKFFSLKNIIMGIVGFLSGIFSPNRDDF